MDPIKDYLGDSADKIFSSAKEKAEKEDPANVAKAEKAEAKAIKQSQTKAIKSRERKKKDEEDEEGDDSHGKKEKGLSKKKAAQHQKYCDYISKYLSSPEFAEHLKAQGFNIGKEKLGKMKIKEVKELYTRIRTSVGNMGDGSLFTWLFYAGVDGVELASQVPTVKDKCDLSGLKKELMSSDKFRRDLEEVRIHSSMSTLLSPYMNLGIDVVRFSLGVANKNRVENKKSADPAKEQKLLDVMSAVSAKEAKVNAPPLPVMNPSLALNIPMPPATGIEVDPTKSLAKLAVIEKTENKEAQSTKTGFSLSL
jgi:hypothetical protein